MDSGTLIDYGLMGAMKWLVESPAFILLIVLVTITVVVILHHLERLLCRYQAKHDQKPKRGLVSTTPVRP